MQHLPRVWFLPFFCCVALWLTGCQSTREHYRDCKSGDWQQIGMKDGDQGLEAQYEERRKFCSVIDSDKVKADSIALYQKGWQLGNDGFWHRLGRADGLAALPVSSFQNQAALDRIREHKTPLNQGAYQQGWALGNGEYWRKTGEQDGYAGLAASIESQRMQAARSFGFNATSYREGWRLGNQGYWTSLGYTDARAGISDIAFQAHATAAKNANVLVREDAYRAAWDLEVVEYWKRTAWDDATHGRDLAMRRVDAKNRQLKLNEVVYQQQWEARLVEYWSDVGHADGFGQPLQWEARMANAAREGVFVIESSRTAYSTAWSAENRRYCDVNHAFEVGRKNAYFAHEVCRAPQQDLTRRAWQGGRAYEAVRNRQASNQSDLERLVHQRDELSDRLDSLGRATAEPEKKGRQDGFAASIGSEAAEKARRAERDLQLERDRQAERERQIENERRELRERIGDLDHKIHELRQVDDRFDNQLRRIKRDVLNLAGSQ